MNIKPNLITDNDWCCIDLLKAELNKWVTMRVSGFFFYREGCCSGVPSIHFCPFCGAEIIAKKTDDGWDWKTVRRT